MDNAIRAMEAKREENLSAIRAKRQQKAEHLRNAEAIDKEIATFQKHADEYTAAVKALKATQGNQVSTPPSQSHELLMQQLRDSVELEEAKAGWGKGDLTEADKEAFREMDALQVKPRRGRPAKGQSKWDAS